MRTAFINALRNAASADPRIFLVTGDLGFGVLSEYCRDLPEQFLNAGVAEQNMTAVACGLALDGRIVFTYSIGNFATLRCLEQIRNDVCYHNANVKIVCIGGGFGYGALGMSHHATEDLTIMRALPNVTVFAPASEFEAEQTVKAMIETPGCCYVRVERSSGLKDLGTENFVVGCARRLREGQDLTLLAAGGILAEVFGAAEDLAADGIQCRVVSLHTVTPIDVQAIVSACEETGGIVTVEENALAGGIGASVAEVCLDRGLRPKRFLRLGVSGYASRVGSQAYLRRQNGIDRACIRNSVIKLVA